MGASARRQILKILNIIGKIRKRVRAAQRFPVTRFWLTVFARNECSGDIVMNEWEGELGVDFRFIFFGCQERGSILGTLRIAALDI